MDDAISVNLILSSQPTALCTVPTMLGQGTSGCIGVYLPCVLVHITGHAFIHACTGHAFIHACTGHAFIHACTGHAFYPYLSCLEMHSILHWPIMTCRGFHHRITASHHRPTHHRPTLHHYVYELHLSLPWIQSSDLPPVALGLARCLAGVDLALRRVLQAGPDGVRSYRGPCL